jgi:aspartyl-tRNA(Asn)/glutamyl-tRNA(Gln) amidotransferase subunit A
MRPTYGLVSRYGVVSSASSFDQVGPLTNSIQDNELVLKIISSKGTKDQTKLKQNVSPISDNEEPIKIGIPKACFGEGISDSIKTKFEEIFNILDKNQNFEIKEIELPSLDYALETYYILQTVEASANLERYDGVRYGKQSDKELFFGSRGDYFGAEVTRRIMIGTYASSSGYYDAYYNQACKTRGKLKEDFKRAFGEVDVMLMPASPFPAFKIGENSNSENPMAMYLADTMTVPEAVGSLPGLVIPSGFVDHEDANLPVGIQLVGPELSESVLYDVGEKLKEVL